MAMLNLVRTEDGKYLLQGTGDESRNADFKLFDWDGEGGDPFAFGSQKWEIIELSGIKNGVEYDADDPDSWWNAQAQIVAAAEQAGIEVPSYAKG